ncbi:Cof-type HAD-IIB family hydrolase [Mangrovibacillus cuniculi]|uniref:Cof-type HAD-IIB family hydrolase n=1 Tax=Mangrovibacillus cuniculi TaxID=2593652 RepID=A0A7S8CE65_9BACI|nr:Cof-type HAD-IIB family hydrolase [Mangrovibacillus cuniculi]QPC48354.1 Cof-type HAD-IIB family hydrolase [Mangrovibacillus cuniculi]
MKKIVFFDIDGTLLDHDKKVPTSTKDSISILQENCIYTAIATGRAPFMYPLLRQELSIESFVSFNGQYVVFEGEEIYTNPLDKEELTRLIDVCNQKNHPLVYMTHESMKANEANHSFIKESMSSLKFDYPEVDPNFYQGRDILQTLLFCTEEDDEFYRSHFPEFHFIRWHPLALDVLPKGGSKAEGIKKFIEKAGFEMENVYAFGDALNDLEMLETVGTGIAMGNASDYVKSFANHVTTPVDQDGIRNGLVTVGLLDK